MISKVLPWNELFYKNCMYNPLISGIIHLGGSALPLLANDFFAYRENLNSKEMRLQIQYLNNQNEFALLKNCGIGMETNIYIRQSPVSQIKEIINMGKMIHIPIDRFYWNEKYNDKYQREHYEHFFLVYNYDDVNKVFGIIDTRGSVCIDSKIGYDDLENCYGGYLDWMRGKEEACSITLLYKEKVRKCSLNFFRKKYTKNLAMILNIITQSVKAIELQKTQLLEIKEDPLLLFEMDVAKVGEPFDFIIRAKNVQLYQSRLFMRNDSQLAESISNVAKLFENFRMILLKQHITKNVNGDKIKYLVDLLGKVREMELDISKRYQNHIALNEGE
jgi:hypothetical protein